MRTKFDNLLPPTKQCKGCSKLAHRLTQAGYCLSSCPSKYKHPYSTTLTQKQLRVLKKLGKNDKTIAAELKTTVRAANYLTYRVFNKLGVSSRAAALVAGLQQGIIQISDLEY